MNGRLEAYIDIRLSAKLYDSAGLNLSGGAVGKAEGQAKVSVKDDLGGYAGSLSFPSARESKEKQWLISRSLIKNAGNRSFLTDL